MVDHENLIKVMVIDDENDIALVVKKALETEGGFEVDVFTNPKQAPAYVKEHLQEYQIILSDIRMPHIGGIEFAKEIRSLNQKVPILLMSAFEMDRQDFASELKAAKIDGFIEKPVSMKKLVEVMRHYVIPSDGSGDKGVSN